ncbi:trafficking protein particle complex subunit 6A isoform X3 [Equus asinus]|uniref:trafficking protein particle complex subunit 6A isoform X3 n=1 Tax=Equus asinus TaxID=9793 RepID=UPI001D049735|nr:trafficking protein particle complex subunit 6A isoform X1 [Equus asinus]
MADAVLFEFLHTEMVAELWAHDPDPGPGVHREQRHTRVPTATCSASASCPPGCGALCVRKVGRAPTPTELPPSPGSAPASPLLAHPGTEYEPVCAGGHGLPCGPGPGREEPSLASSFFLTLGSSSLARRPPSISLAQVSAAAPQAVPGDAGLQGGAGHPQVPVQRPVDGRVPEADGQPPHQPPGDLRPAGQQFPPPHPDGLRPAVSGGSTQVTCAPRPQFLAFTCGLLRGTLCTLGVKSLVTASVAALPACKFQVVIQKS